MKDVIQKKLETYHSTTVEDEENALKEISQEVLLYALNLSGFFEQAVFQGGTCLRIVHGLNRFSEDLDFALRVPNPNFKIEAYLEKVVEIMNLYGYQIKISGEDQASSNLRSRFLKDDSIKKLLDFEHRQDVRKQIQIKVEIDTNPPSQDKVESNYLDFPVNFMIMTHDLPSLMSGKCHALLCRPYLKGRDWYDFLWYISKNISPNKLMLREAINQQGPWKDKNIDITNEWILESLNQKIKNIDWNQAQKDVSRFLKPDEREQLKMWSEDFFLKRAYKLFQILSSHNEKNF